MKHLKKKHVTETIDLPGRFVGVMMACVFKEVEGLHPTRVGPYQLYLGEITPLSRVK